MGVKIKVLCEVADSRSSAQAAAGSRFTSTPDTDRFPAWPPFRSSGHALNIGCSASNRRSFSPGALTHPSSGSACRPNMLAKRTLFRDKHFCSSPRRGDCIFKNFNARENGAVRTHKPKRSGLYSSDRSISRRSTFVHQPEHCVH
jgi:hypothetical protein